MAHLPPWGCAEDAPSSLKAVHKHPSPSSPTMKKANSIVCILSLAIVLLQNDEVASYQPTTKIHLRAKLPQPTATSPPMGKVQPSRGTARHNTLLLRMLTNDEKPGESTHHSNDRSQMNTLSELLSTFTFYTPLWTVFVTILALKNPEHTASSLGAVSVMQRALVILMMAMGLTITPEEVTSVLKNDKAALATNGMLCFGMMPVLALILSKVLSYTPDQTAGMILLGSVSGGQASNLFTLIAGGNVALSVICTLSTTLLGVLATPLLIQTLLGYSVNVDTNAVLRSIGSLVLLPLLSGLGLGRFSPNLVQGIVPVLPTVGVLATMVLVAGGASTTAVASSVAVAGWRTLDFTTIFASCLLSLVGGGAAWLILTCRRDTDEGTKKALTIETLSKSPTLAFVLARKHFGIRAARIPAAAMVTLAVVGALVASLFSKLGSCSPNNSKQ